MSDLSKGIQLVSSKTRTSTQVFSLGLSSFPFWAGSLYSHIQKKHRNRASWTVRVNLISKQLNRLRKHGYQMATGQRNHECTVPLGSLNLKQYVLYSKVSVPFNPK